MHVKVGSRVYLADRKKYGTVIKDSILGLKKSDSLVILTEGPKVLAAYSGIAASRDVFCADTWLNNNGCKLEDEARET